MYLIWAAKTCGDISANASCSLREGLQCPQATRQTCAWSTLANVASSTCVIPFDLSHAFSGVILLPPVVVVLIIGVIALFVKSLLTNCVICGYNTGNNNTKGGDIMPYSPEFGKRFRDLLESRGLRGLDAPYRHLGDIVSRGTILNWRKGMPAPWQDDPKLAAVLERLGASVDDVADVLEKRIAA